MYLITAHFATLGGDHIQSIHASRIGLHAPALLTMLAVICKRVQRVDFESCGDLGCVDSLLRQSRATLESIRIEYSNAGSCSALDGLDMPRLRQLTVRGQHMSRETLVKPLKLSTCLEDVNIATAVVDESCVEALCGSATALLG